MASMIDFIFDGFFMIPPRRVDGRSILGCFGLECARIHAKRMCALAAGEGNDFCRLAIVTLGHQFAPVRSAFENATVRRIVPSVDSSTICTRIQPIA